MKKEKKSRIDIFSFKNNNNNLVEATKESDKGTGHLCRNEKMK